MTIRIYTLISTTLVALTLTAAVGRAQSSLADLARDEESRRKDVRQPAKVYTNKDLPNVPSPVSAAPAGDAAKGTAAAAAPAEKDQKAGETKDKPKEAVKDQAYWSTRMRDARTALERNETFAEALQSRINGLTADFTSRDDPAQRAMVSQDRQKALSELERVKSAIQSDKKAISDLEEEARRASVPAGWLR